MPPKRKPPTSEQSDAKRAKRDDSAADTTDYHGDLNAERVAQMSYEELRLALKSIGENPGPINDSTRPMYEKMLVKRHQQKKKGNTVKAAVTSSPLASSTSMFSPSTTFESLPTSFTTPEHEQSQVSPSPGASLGGGIGQSTVSLSKKPATKRGGKATTTTQTQSSQALRGIIPATYTPLTLSGDINLPIIDVYANYLVRNGVAAVFVNGSTGEGVKLSVDERKQVLERWIHSLNGRLPVLAHVGAESLKDTQELAMHARAFGASAIAVMAPCAFKPRSAEHMVQYLLAVAAVVPNMPLYAYHIPVMTGTTFCIEEFLDRAVALIPSFVGVKYTDTDLSKFLACKAHSSGKLHMMYGKDEQMLAALAMGADTFVGSTYSLCPQLYHSLMKAFNNGQLAIAQQEQLRSQRMVKCLLAHGGVVPAGRALLTLRGVAVGPPRLPDRELSSQGVAELERDLRALGFFKWA